MARLVELVAAAKASPFVIGHRVRQPPQVQALQQRVRQVTARHSPRWTTEAAAMAPTSMRVDVDHVVPVVVLVERMLLGDDTQAVVDQSVLCRLTHDEHRRGGLEVAFRTKQRDLYERMLACPLESLADVGWDRYRLAGITFRPL